MNLKHLFHLTFALGMALQAAGPAVRLALVVEFPPAVPPETRRAMEAEVRRTLSIESMGIEWRETLAPDGEEWFDRVAIIRVKGRCSAEAGLRPGALGTTHVSDGQVLPFIDLDSDRVAAMLRAEIAPLGPYPAAPTLGQALGRVAAHELYHVLAKTQEHGRQGLAKPQFSRADLLLGHTGRMDPADLRRMQVELLRGRSDAVAAGGGE